MTQTLPSGVIASLTGPGPISRGDRVPDFVLPGADGMGRFFYGEVTGDPILVFVAHRLHSGTARAELEGFARECTAERPPVHCIAITNGAPPGPGSVIPAIDQFPGIVLYDQENAVRDVFGIDWNDPHHRSRTFILDPNQRLLSVVDGVENQARRAMDYLVEHGSPAESDQATGDAPVLLVPRVFEPDFCRRLIETFHVRGAREGGVENAVEGQAQGRVDQTMKRRADHLVDDQELLSEIHLRFARRLVPEISRAWWFKVSEAVGFKIGCYREQDHGFFRMHRDNSSPRVAHRQFAFSVNLNTGEYDGGGLRFPEYGGRIYHPEAGEAVVFSCSLLHEVTEVSRGERFVLLGFLFDEAAARARDAFNKELVRRKQANGAGRPS